MYPFDKLEILLFFQTIIIGSYISASLIVNKKATRFINSIDLKLNYESKLNLDSNFIKTQIQEKISIENFDFKITNVNTIINEIEIKVFY